MQTILVADDNPTNQLLVEAQLKKLGYTCDIAASEPVISNRLSGSAPVAWR